MAANPDVSSHFRLMGPNRRTLPVIAALAALALSTVAIAPAGAQAPTTGGGTSSGGTELLRVQLGGGALDIRIGRELSQTIHDPSVGPASAVEQLIPLTVGSTLVPALGALSTAPIEVASSGDEKSVSSPTIDLASVAGAAPVPGLLSGTLQPFSLRAVVDALGSVADATGAASGVSVLGGVLELGELQALLGSDALLDGASAGRLLSLDQVEVLDLEALLQLLGLGITDLPVGVAAGLLEQLGLPLPGGLGSAGALVAQVESLLAQAGDVPALLRDLTDQLAVLQAAVAAATAELAPLLEFLDCDPLLALPLLGDLACSTILSLIDTLEAEIASLNTQIAALTAQIDALLETVADLLQPLFDILNGLVDGLAGAPLLTVRDLSLGVVADAVDTLAGSTADVTGSVGSIQIGNLPALTGTDLVALADQATAALGSVLSVLDPVLGDLVAIDLLADTTSVREENGKNVAEAAVTGLLVGLTPPNVCGILDRLGGIGDSIGGLLGSLAQSVPSLPLPVGDVLGQLGSTLSCTVDGEAVLLSALTQPLSVEVLSVTGRGEFAAVATQTTPTTQPTVPLARTGGATSSVVPMAALGVAFAGFVLTRRLLARAS